MADFDTSKLLVDFTQCKKGVRLVNHFSELSAFDEFSQQQDENIIKIAILTADVDSPFLKLRGDHGIMLKTIFDFLHIGMENKIGKEFFNKVLEYKHEGLAQCWSAYLQLQYNVDFTDWAISKQTYDMLINESNRQRDETRESAIDYANWRIKLRNQIRQIGEDLKKIEPVIFKDSKMAKPVALEERKKIKSYPERHAIKHSLM